METGGRVGDGLLDLCRDPLGGGVSDRNLCIFVLEDNVPEARSLDPNSRITKSGQTLRSMLCGRVKDGVQLFAPR